MFVASPAVFDGSSATCDAVNWSRLECTSDMHDLQCAALFMKGYKADVDDHRSISLPCANKLTG